MMLFAGLIAMVLLAACSNDNDICDCDEEEEIEVVE